MWSTNVSVNINWNISLTFSGTDTVEPAVPSLKSSTQTGTNFSVQLKSLNVSEYNYNIVIGVLPDVRSHCSSPI